MARKLKVDMTGVESFVKCEEGEHICILKEIEEKVSQSGNDMLSAKFEVVKGSSTGATVYDNFPLIETALWKLKSYLEAVGMKSEGRLILDLDKLIGKKLIISVIHEEYDGKNRAKIDGYKKLAAAKIEEEPEDEDYEDDEEIEDEEEEETPPPKKKPAKKPAPPKKKKPVVEDDEDEDDDWEE